MRFILLFLFFPLITFSQELPDSSVASRMKVKKLIILKCNSGFPPDTENVYLLNRTWKDESGNPVVKDFIRKDTLERKIVRDDKGRIIFTSPVKSDRPCFFDTCGGQYFHYDNENRIIGGDYYSY